MSNYEDWDPEWQPVGDPVPTDDDWNEYDWNEYDSSAYDSSDYDWNEYDSGEESSPEAYAPSEPSRPGMAFADVEAEYGDATDGEFSMPPGQGEESALQDNPELAVFRRWRAKLGMPVEPDVGGAAPAYAYPDVEEGYGASAYAAPRPYQYSVPLPSADWEGPKFPGLVTPTAESWKPLTTEPSQPQPPAWLQSELQRLRGWESFRQDLQARWDRFQKEYQSAQAWQAAHDPTSMEFQPDSLPMQPEYPERVPKLMEPAVPKGFPQNWNKMSTEERLAWLETLGPGHSIEDTQNPLAALVDAAAQANQYVSERTPGVGGAEKLVFQDVPEAIALIPRSGGLMMQEAEQRPETTGFVLNAAMAGAGPVGGLIQGLHAAGLPVPSGTEIGKQVFNIQASQAPTLERVIEELKQNPLTWSQLEKELQQAPSVWREKAPLPVQLVSDLVDPGYIAAGKVLEAPKVLSQVGKWDVVKTALRGQGLESYVPFVEQMIKDAGGWGSKGASRVLKEADELFVAPATAAKVREGEDLVLRVLNKNKREGVPLFTRDNLARRKDEAKAILDEYASKTKEVDTLKGPLFKRWNTLPQSMKDDISQKSLMDAMTGLESRYAYGLESKPKGWLHAISDVNGLGAINKILGEAAGNEVIAQLGRVIKAKVKEGGGRAFRYGGDEIKMWFPDEDTAQKTLAAIDKEFRDRIIEYELPNGSIVREKGFSIAYGYGRDEVAADNALNAHKLELERIGRRAGKDKLPGGVSKVSGRVGLGSENKPGLAADRRVQDDLGAQAGRTARAGQVAAPTGAVPRHERWHTLPPSSKDEIGRRALLDAATGLESRFAYKLGTKPQGWVDAVTGLNGLAGINEAFGHPAADDLLDAIGRIVKANVEEEGGRAFRIGGDVIKLWFPDDESARRALTAIDREVKERIFPVTLRDGTVVWKKGITISYGYGPGELAAAKALSADKLRRESMGERAPRGVLTPSIVDVPFHAGTAGERNAAAAAAMARAGVIGAAARAARGFENSQVDTPRLVLQYLRQRLSSLGYTGSMIDQLRLSEAAHIIAGGRTPKPGGVGSGQRPSRSRPPLSISQQMAQLYRGTIAGDDYWRQPRARPPRRRGGRGHATTRLVA